MPTKAPLPPGWEAKYDSRTGKYYFITHYTKETTWEDPRFVSGPEEDPEEDPEEALDSTTGSNISGGATAGLSKKEETDAAVGVEMSANAPLPQGWEAKYDNRAGK